MRKRKRKSSSSDPSESMSVKQSASLDISKSGSDNTPLTSSINSLPNLTSPGILSPTSLPRLYGQLSTLDLHGQHGQSATFDPLGQSATLDPLGQSATLDPLGQSATLGPLGQSATLDPLGQSATLDPHGQAATLDPRGQTATLDPLGQSATLDPLGQTATLDPLGQAATLDPHGQSATLDPRGQAATLDPRGQAATLDPLGQSATLDPRGQAATLDPLGQSATLGPLGQSATLDPLGQSATLDPRGQAATLDPLGQAATLDPLGQYVQAATLDSPGLEGPGQYGLVAPLTNASQYDVHSTSIQSEPLDLTAKDSGLLDNSSEDDREMSVMVTAFKNMTLRRQEMLLDNLLSAAQHHDRHFLVHSMHKHVACTCIVHECGYVDFMATLPLEMAVKILYYLDGATFIRARQVSHKWKELIDKEGKKWEEICRNRGIYVPPYEDCEALRNVLKTGTTDLLAKLKNGSLFSVTQLQYHNCEIMTLAHHNGQIASGITSCRYASLGNNLPGDDDGYVVIWHKDKDKDHWDRKQELDAGVPVLCIYFDDRFLFAGCRDCKIRLFSTQQGDGNYCLKVFTGHTAGLKSIDFNSELDLVASLSVEGKIILWDRDTEQVFKTFTCDRNYDHDAPLLIKCFGKVFFANNGDRATFVIVGVKKFSTEIHQWCLSKNDKRTVIREECIDLSSDGLYETFCLSGQHIRMLNNTDCVYGVDDDGYIEVWYNILTADNAIPQIPNAHRVPSHLNEREEEVQFVNFMASGQHFNIFLVTVENKNTRDMETYLDIVRRGDGVIINSYCLSHEVNGIIGTRQQARDTAVGTNKWIDGLGLSLDKDQLILACSSTVSGNDYTVVIVEANWLTCDDNETNVT